MIGESSNNRVGVFSRNMENQSDLLIPMYNSDTDMCTHHIVNLRYRGLETGVSRVVFTFCFFLPAFHLFLVSLSLFIRLAFSLFRSFGLSHFQSPSIRPSFHIVRHLHLSDRGGPHLHHALNQN